MKTAGDIKASSCTRQKKLIDDSLSPIGAINGKTASIIDTRLRQNVQLKCDQSALFKMIDDSSTRCNLQ